MSLLDLVLVPLQYDFMLRALLATVAAAVVCALLSCWLVLVGWSLMGDAVSHAVLPGVVLAYMIGAPFALGALVFGLLAVVLIGAVRGTSRVKEDAAIGIVFTTLFALGLVLISVTPSQTDLNHIIFGNILGVSRGDLLQICLLAGVALVALLLKRRDLTLYAFDPLHARAIGLSPRFLGGLLLGVLALTAVVALQVVGVVLVVAMLIVPGATAHLLTDRFSRMLLIAPAISVSSAVLGILLELLGGCLLGRAGGAGAGRGVRPGVPARAAARAAGPGAQRASAPEGEPGASVTHTAPVAERPSVRLSCAPLIATSTASENGVPGRTSSTVPIPMPRSAKKVSSCGSASEIRSTRPVDPAGSSDSSTASGRSTLPSAAGIGSPCGSREGWPRCWSIRSTRKSETACSRCSASSWTWSQL